MKRIETEEEIKCKRAERNNERNRTEDKKKYTKNNKIRKKER